MRRWGFFCVILIVCTCAYGDILTVPGGYATIGEAIGAAVDTDIIIVDPGIYYEHLDMDGKAITLMSTDPNDPAVIASTIIDGDESGRVILCNSKEDADTVIAGFTIQNGSAGDWGGGIYCYAASPTIKNCVLQANASDGSPGLGGGIFCYSNANPLIANCRFYGNTAVQNGGGIDCYNADPTIISCVFRGNDAEQGGGLAFTNGSEPTVINCSVSDNTADIGGGMFCTGNSDLIVANSIFWGNSASTDSEISRSAGNDLTISYTVITGCGGSGGDWVSTFGTDDGGNLDADPNFIDDDLHVDAFSVCINAGDPNGTYAEQSDADLTARVRYGRVDIGADEVFYIGADLSEDDQNEQVNVVDLALFADSWLNDLDLTEFALFSKQWLFGASDSIDGDLDGSGCVDMTDLVLFVDSDGWMVAYDLDYFAKLAGNWLACDN